MAINKLPYMVHDKYCKLQSTEYGISELTWSNYALDKAVPCSRKKKKKSGDTEKGSRIPPTSTSIFVVLS
ncbi:hypothetical protein RRG08_060247 [Elysia crispata]|uniref:Uncharacterized protein n=1 Tax=Elysia crispata TaxID=231223 RepID=A0AAE1CPS8_9GAST|nr:hypothetical protein RRG08_060247 [Elysia crispata]